MSQQLSIGQKLEAVARLPCGRGGLHSTEFSEVQIWVALAGPKFDTSVLSQKTVEHICTLYHAHHDD